MDIRKTDIPDVVALTPRRFGDARGWFTESWNARRMAEAGLDIRFVQDNESFSADPGTVRGLHFQAPPHAQGKLVRVLSGAIIDVAVDVRRGSPSFGKWVKEELSAENGVQLWVPAGFLHGFATLQPNTQVAYKVTDFYAPEADGSVRFDDPALAIDWGIDTTAAVLSDKDAAAGSFQDFETPFSWEANT